MKRIAIIAGIVVASLVAILALTTLFLLRTQPGRDFLIARAEPAIGAALGGEARIGAFRGAPPGRVILEDIVLSDAEGPWARVARIDLSWRPLDLIGGDIDVNRLEIDRAHLLREPPARPPAEEEEDNEPLAIELPDGLPSLRVGELAINDFRSDLSGLEARLDGVGALAMGGRRIDANLRVTSDNDLDTIDLALQLSPDAERIFIDATLASEPAGLIASLASLDGPLFLEINADSPTDDVDVALAGRLGAYGAITANLAGDLQNAVRLDATGEFTPGDALGDIDELSVPVQFDLSIEDRDRAGVLTINRLAAAPGVVDGTLEWRGISEPGGNAEAALNLSLAEGYRPEIQDILGDAVTAEVKLNRRDEDYAAAARVAGDGVSIAVEDMATDLKKAFAGALSVSAESGRIPSAPGGDIAASANFDVVLDDRASLRNLQAAIGEDFSLSGVADYNFTTNAARFEGDVEAGPDFIAAFSEEAAPQGAITASIDLEGPVDDMTLNAEVETPRIVIAENAAPPIIGRAALAGLPATPNGEISGRAVNGTGDFLARFRSTREGAVTVPALRYDGPNFLLEGDGAYDPAQESGRLKLTYNGEPTAQPFPGVPISGRLSIDGRFSRQGRDTQVSIDAPTLKTPYADISNLKGTIEGPPSAIAASLSVEEINAPQTGPVRDARFAATLNLEAAPRIRLTDLQATLFENTLALQEPGVVTLDEGAAIDNLRLAWGREGRIALDGGFSSERWRADLRMSEINIPNTDSRVSAGLDLDTDRGEPARGDFALRSLLIEDEEEVAVDGEFRWNGEALVLTSAPGATGLDMRLSLPAALRKTPAIAVEAGGDLDGYVRYDGPLNVFAAFLPPELQTLEGGLDINFDVGGTTTAPELSGRAAIIDGAYTEIRSGLSIIAINVAADAEYGPAGTMVEFSGGARGGAQSSGETIKVAGDMSLGETSQVDVTVTLDNAAVSASPVNNVRVNGDINIAGPLDAIKAVGEIVIRELDAQIVTPESTGLVDIEVVNIDNAGARSEEESGPAESSFNFDISIEADDRIFIRGRGLDSEWAASLRAQSEDGEAIILGRINLRRGALDFSGRRFDLTRGDIRFDRTAVNNPTLDIRAEYDAGEILAALVVSGRAQSPEIQLVSTPSRPSEDIMSLILFGKPAGELTAVESLQTAQALAQLGGVGPFAGGGGGGLTGTLRQATGLDLLNFDVDPESGGGSLTVGKYVADGLFVSATQDAQGNSGAVRVEYEITDNISIETEIEQNGEQTVSANWKRDF